MIHRTFASVYLFLSLASSSSIITGSVAATVTLVFLPVRESWNISQISRLVVVVNQVALVIIVSGKVNSRYTRAFIHFATPEGFSWLASASQASE